MATQTRGRDGTADDASRNADAARAGPDVGEQKSQTTRDDPDAPVRYMVKVLPQAYCCDCHAVRAEFESVRAVSGSEGAIVVNFVICSKGFTSACLE